LVEEPLEKLRPRRRWDFDIEGNWRYGNVSCRDVGICLCDALLTDCDSSGLHNPLAPE